MATIHETNAVPVVFTTHAALFFGPSFFGHNFRDTELQYS